MADDGLGQQVDRRAHRDAVAHQRRQVAEQDARLGEVGDVAHARAQQRAPRIAFDAAQDGPFGQLGGGSPSGCGESARRGPRNASGDRWRGRSGRPARCDRRRGPAAPAPPAAPSCARRRSADRRRAARRPGCRSRGCRCPRRRRARRPPRTPACRPAPAGRSLVRPALARAERRADDDPAGGERPAKRRLPDGGERAAAAPPPAARRGGGCPGDARTKISRPGRASAGSARPLISRRSAIGTSARFAIASSVSPGRDDVPACRRALGVQRRRPRGTR